jgi:hypothetical protein
VRVRARRWWFLGAALIGVAPLLAGCIAFGAPTEHQLNTVEGTRVSALVWADVTGDGTDDLIAAMSDSTIRRLEPCGGGCVNPREVIAVPSAIPSLGATVADVDADGAEDLIVKGFLIDVYFGSAGGPGRAPGLDASDKVTVPIGSSLPIADDLDGDGDVDLGVIYPTGPFSNGIPVGYGILPGDGTGGFGALVPVASGLFGGRSWTAQLSAGDVDGDGGVEAIAWGNGVNEQGYPPSVTVLSDAGTVLAQWAPPGGGWITDLEVADLDGDGRDDLAVGVSPTSVGVSAVHLVRSTPAGLVPFETPTGPQVLQPRTRFDQIALADADADGDVDVLGTEPFGVGVPGMLSWWEGEPGGIPADAERTDHSLPEPVGLIAFGDAGLPNPALALGQQGGFFSAIYVVPNLSV